jgi:lipopolysaccharide transport system ATP-binding protein
MSNEVAISVEHLSKVYRIGGKQEGYRTFRDTVTGLVKRFGRRRKGRNEPFWALRNLSFEVKRGEVVGIIGRNGAGKSTLLKILSRITEPAEGFAEIHGRIGSLLEVGTGFHPELTGRENVFLNGAILGMRRGEIEKKFDEIVAFAEVQQFLDTPVKNYSSGMYLRMAFAVAAHLEPEILLVDEVLAVGDAQFQRKCLGKMGEVASRGRTVLFVSHNMSAIQSLCGRAICLASGEIVADDVPAKCIASYFSTLDQAALPDLTQRQDRRGAGGVRMTRIDLVDPASGEPRRPVLGLPLRFLFRVSTMTPDLVCGFTVFDLHGVAVACFNTAASSGQDKIEPAAGPAFACDVDELPLAPGRYRISTSLFRGPVLEDRIESACVFDVDTGVMGDRPVLPMRGIGMVCIRHHWSSPSVGG